MAKKAPRFPKRIYVQWERGQGADEFYLLASETPEDIEDDQAAVGVYDFREAQVLRIERHLEKK